MDKESLEARNASKPYQEPLPTTDTAQQATQSGDVAGTHVQQRRSSSICLGTASTESCEDPSTENRIAIKQHPSPVEQELEASERKKANAAPSGIDERQNSQPEIQEILEQFQRLGTSSRHSPNASSMEDGNSTRTEAFTHPPRMSSLSSPRSENAFHSGDFSRDLLPAKPKESNESGTQSHNNQTNTTRTHSPLGRQSSEVISSRLAGVVSPLASPSLNKSLPPAPDPEPDLPFDFHRFLEQLRHRTADPVAKFLRSFLVEFGKKQWLAHEQVKIIGDFLFFITGKMQQCEVWREVSDAEFDNAKEGMEKLVMNRLYSQTFSPAIPAPPAHPPSKGKKRVPDRPMAPGRRGQHQEDVERDEILAQKVRIYSWVRERHLDISPVGENGQRFLSLAQQELLKIKSYRAPRDKVICVLNCCKVIFGLLRNSKIADTSADSFIPLLIYVVLQASPEHLVSNIQYILRFRNQDKLGGETGYYLSSLLGAIQFIENLDRTTLTVSDIEFEENVEAAVSAIAERESPETSMPGTVNLDKFPKAAPELDRHDQTRLRSRDLNNNNTRHASTNTTETSPDFAEDKAAMGNILRTIQKPLSSIGRMFSEEPAAPDADDRNVDHPTSRQLSPAIFQPPHLDEESANASERFPRRSSRDLAAQQATMSVSETTGVLDTRDTEHREVVETLASMFPNLDRDVLEDVVRMKQGRVGSAVDACLALNT